MCSVCGQGFCWDHILTLRFAQEEAILQKRSVCRNCTEQIVEEIEEERRHLSHDVQVLQQDVAALQKQVEEIEEEVDTSTMSRSYSRISRLSKSKRRKNQRDTLMDDHGL